MKGCSNLYKEKWDIEQCFAYFKNSVDITASSRRSNESVLRWIFINHENLLYFCFLILAIRKSGMNNEGIPNEIIMIAKNVYQINMVGGVLKRDKYIISEVSKKDEKLFSALGVNLLRH